MSTWADESEGHLQPAPSSYTGERPKLNLKPRRCVLNNGFRFLVRPEIDLLMFVLELKLTEALLF